MAVTTKKGATYQDVLDAPDDRTAELIDGELFVSPRPNNRGNYVHTRLGGKLHVAFDQGDGGPRGWIIVIEPALHLGGHVLVPDMAGWRRSRMPVMPDGPAVSMAPDWVCEVLSTSTARLDRIRKMRLYAQLGIAHAWLVDPGAAILEVYRNSGGAWIQAAVHGDELVRAEPFEAIEIDLAKIWDLPGRVGEPPAVYG